MDETLLQITTNTEHKLLMKWEHYFDIYEKYLSKFRNTKLNFMEIGVCFGGSMDVWSKYFGKAAKIIGIDNSISVKNLDYPDNVNVLICDQENRTELEETFRNQEFDVIIDDGGHTMNQQINSFEALFPLLNCEHGVYIVEDTHTSYWNSFGGGLRKKTTFMEFAKSLIDYINVDHFREDDNLSLYEPLKLSLINHLTEIHFYDSMVIFIKGNKNPKSTYHYYGNSKVLNAGTSKQVYPNNNA